MSNYVQITDFTAKDSLPSGNAAKLVKGVDFDGEFAAISTAITSKVDKTGSAMTGDLTFNDSSKLLLGDESDLQIYHEGSHSRIRDTGTGNLYIEGSSNISLISPASTYAVFGPSSVELNYSNSKKLETTTGGVDITGTATATTAFTAPSATFTALASSGLDVIGETETDTLVVDNNADGVIVRFNKGGTLCGGVRTALTGGVPDLTIGSGIASLRYAVGIGAGSISPARLSDNVAQDGVLDLGLASAQWDDIYSVNAVTVSSDRNVKQSIEELTEAEKRVARSCKGLVCKFKYNAAVEKKGIDGARYHFGVIAQELQAAFEAEGLDAGEYGVFVSTTWTDEEGVEQTKLGVRYTELLAFIIGGLV